MSGVEAKEVKCEDVRCRQEKLLINLEIVSLVTVHQGYVKETRVGLSKVSGMLIAEDFPLFCIIP